MYLEHNSLPYQGKPGVCRRSLANFPHLQFVPPPSKPFIMSATPARSPPLFPYERSSLGRLPVEVSQILVSKKNSRSLTSLPTPPKVANLRDPTVHVVKTLSTRLQVPLRGLQTISTILSRSVHPREARSSHSHKP